MIRNTLQQRKNEKEKFADFLISTSPDEISCKEHEKGQEKNARRQQIKRQSTPQP